MDLINLYIGVGQGNIHSQHQEVMKANPGNWVLVDNFVEREDIVKMDGANLTFDPGSINIIYASHLLEHFEIRQVPSVLKNWYSQLREGGKVIFNIPDFDWICQAWLNPDLRLPYWKEDIKMLEAFYGGEDEPGEFHKTGWNEKMVIFRFAEAGFKDIKVLHEIEAHEMMCLVGEAYK